MTADRPEPPPVDGTRTDIDKLKPGELLKRAKNMAAELRQLRSDLQKRTAELARVRERHGDYD